MQPPGRPVRLVDGRRAAIGTPSASTSSTRWVSRGVLVTPHLRSPGPAASLPEISTIGTPTPGCVPEPVNTTFGSVGCRLPGRNGPVCANVCAAANGVPAAMP